jgi:hypothetical protein
MSLESERRAIRNGVAAGRAATGGNERRAIGKRIESERRGAAVVEDLKRLQSAPQQRRTLRTVPPVGAVPAARGSATYVAPPETGGGGISSPLTETPGTRTFHTPRVVTTTDGMFTFALRRVATITMTDATDAEVLMEFENVSGT